jgi:hypothetical protein
MPMVKATLKAQLLNFFNNNNRTPNEAADELATIIDTYIRTATVTTTGVGVGVATPALVVSTTTTSAGTVA